MADEVYTISDFDVLSSDKIRLMGITYTPKENIKGTITLVHGFGEHIGRYSHVLDFFARQGYVISTYDQRGHGKSGGQRSHSPSMDLCLHDLGLVVARASPDLPHFLYGHSFGGGLSLLYIERMKPPFPFSGVIVTDPLIKLYFSPPKAKVVVGRMISKLAPSFSMYNEIKPDALSRDAAVGKAYMEDPLVGKTITTCMGSIILDMGDWIIKDADKINVPILFIHGTGDTITSYLATQQVHDLANSTDKTIKLLEGWYHEPHNETEKQELFDLIAEWLRNHTPVSGGA